MICPDRTSAQQVLDKQLHHLRIDGPREWSEFPERADSTHLDLKFEAEKNNGEWTVQLRHQDVKQVWDVSLNGKSLARLRQDENDMLEYFPLSANALIDGENVLTIEQSSRGKSMPDDVRIGEVTLHRRPMQEVLNDATVEIEVVDEGTNEQLPTRLTVVNEDGALQTVGAVSNEHLAVRPGVVYTSNGKAQFGLPAGEYTIYAGRGFEYSLDSIEVMAAAGESMKETLRIRREVPTEGYVACDTHVHTLTHSGHGDATVEERMITLAAEAIELPIATDHNVHIDHDSFARQMNIRQYFTPVIGNEVTTRIGHFNVFPVQSGATPPNHKLEDWASIFNDIYRTPNVKIAILNHARDLHGGTRPFGPKLHNAVVGENLDGWKMQFNAMEVINSGATQSDPMQLFHDWMGLLNRGRTVTPVGSSDSHDVARHFVGQGRTYIRCDDRDPGHIDIEMAVNNFEQGRVLVSYGLIAELTVNGKYGPGELAKVTDDEMEVAIRILGPHWVKATRVEMYANGKLIRESTIDSESHRDLPSGVKWQGKWMLKKPKHDMHLVAIATGPGIDGVFWKTAKPYQPTSTDWEAKVIGCSGAVWLDVDGDGRKTPAYDYAQREFSKANGSFTNLLDRLSKYDEAVAAQAAHLCESSSANLLADETLTSLDKATESTRVGFHKYITAWRECEQERGRER